MSNRLASVSASASMQMIDRIAELRAGGRDIIDLTVGEPDFDTPGIVKNAAIEAINRNFSHYTSARGAAELREEITAFIAGKKGVRIATDSIIVTPGGKQGVFYTFAAILERGDEVIIPEPAWLSYGDIVRLNDGVPVFVPSNESEGFIPPVDRIKKAVTKKTRAILINNPTNPTGALYSREYILELLELCEERGLFLVSDEVYSDIIYDRQKFFSVLETKSPRAVYIGSLSKMAAMTGWRLGYVIADRKIIDACTKMQQQTATCPSSISQAAAIAAFRHYDRYAPHMLAEYQKRRDFLAEGINGLGLKCLKPKGAFYLFANTGKISKSSQEAANVLLERAHVACVPGAAYGASGEGYVRFSFATSRKNLELALERIVNAIGL